MTSVVVRYLDKAKVLADLQALAIRIGTAHREVQEVRLFGSLARGGRNPYADADVLIVLDACAVPYRDRSPLYKPLGAPVPMDLIVCTRAELEREIAADNRFVRRILDESRPLYVRPAAPSPA